MKSHGMQFIGELWIQRVPVLPEWTSEDISRLIFVEDKNIVYVGSIDGFWRPVGQYFRDSGLASDPETAVYFTNRAYTMSIKNGNIILTYDE